MGLLSAMKTMKGQRTLTLYWDIETLAYNKVDGRNKPTKYKNVVYSVAVGWDNNGTIDVEVFPSFSAFFDAFFDYAKRKDTITKSRTTIQMIAHNCNKYDNHFLLHDFYYYFDNLKRENLFMKNALTNENTVNVKEAKQDSKDENIVLEKRVKSSINLDLTAFLNGFKFVVVDNFMKTTTSIATLGKKLKDSGYLTDDQLKTDFQYDLFDVEHDMTQHQAYAYAYECFKVLDKDQMTYIHNDVIILGQSHIHYAEIFPGFDYSKMTFSVNILESYMNNETTRFQLLNERYIDGEKKEINYTNYQFFDLNLYEYIKGFYRGGLNMYNPKYVDTIIEEPCFSIDINSSYPYVMYNEKVPTWLSDYDEFEVETEIETDLEDKDTFILFKVHKNTFNTDILYKIESDMIRKMLVKYYNNEDDYVNINTNTLRMIEDLTDVDCSTIYCMSYLAYDCEYFGARDIIFENYYIKTQGKSKTKIIMTSPFDYEETDEINETVYSQEEVNLSKVILNGLYGIPALRSHFNLFRVDETGELKNAINGYKNSERNILFSTFVTSQSLYNLLEPLQALTQKEIDENFVYCDTDSLYLKSTVKPLLPDYLFDPISLGKWDVENDIIEKMYVLNHKKYAYQKPNGKIHVASAGIPLDAFDTNQPFNDFITNDFHHGAVIYNNKSIYNDQKTISIYPSKTHIEKGYDYQNYFNEVLNDKRKMVLNKVREEYDHSQSEDFIYIESEVGTFSARDVFPVEYKLREKNNLHILKASQDMIRNSI